MRGRVEVSVGCRDEGEKLSNKVKMDFHLLHILV